MRVAKRLRLEAMEQRSDCVRRHLLKPHLHGVDVALGQRNGNIICFGAHEAIRIIGKLIRCLVVVGTVCADTAWLDAEACVVVIHLVVLIIHVATIAACVLV